MNVSILICSLKYIDKNHHLVTCLSTWIDEELKIKQFTKDKFRLIMYDYKVLKSLIHLIDKNILSKYSNECYPCLCDDFDLEHKIESFNILELFLNNDISLNIDNELLFEECCEFGQYKLVKILLEKGIQLDVDTLVFTKLDLLMTKDLETCKNISRLFIQHGQICDLMNFFYPVSQEFMDMLLELL